MSTMTCGRWLTFSPPNSSTPTTLSRLKRDTDCAEAGAAGRSAKRQRTMAVRVVVIVEEDLESGVLQHMTRVCCHAGKRVGERADDLGMKLGAGAAPQLA